MTEAIRNTLRDSKTARWTALLVISFTMFAGYYMADVMAPLKGLLEKNSPGPVPSMASLPAPMAGSMYFFSS